MTGPAIVTSASDIAAILDTVAPDTDTPLADTPIWNELLPRWEAMQTRFRNLESGIEHTVLPDQPVQVVQDPTAPAMPPRPRRNTSRKSPNKASTGSSTRRAANTPQAPTEKVSASTPEAEPEEAS